MRISIRLGENGMRDVAYICDDSYAWPHLLSDPCKFERRLVDVSALIKIRRWK